MDYDKASLIAEAVRDYSSVLAISKDLQASINACPGAGVVTVTIPRRLLAPLKSLLDSEAERLLARIEQL